MVWAASARSGLPWRDLWEVLWEWTRKSLLGKRCDSPIGLRCESSHATVHAEKPDHASVMEMGSRMIAPFGHDERNWG